jgi:hypothetical protein
MRAVVVVVFVLATAATRVWSRLVHLGQPTAMILIVLATSAVIAYWKSSH